MVTTIVIPHSQASEPRVEELASIGDFQEVAGGWLEPFDIPVLGITFWANEAAPRQHERMNGRATALCWYYNVRSDTAGAIVGDVVVAGTVTPDGSAEIPEPVLDGLLNPHEFVVQISPHDDGVWRDTYARFGNVYEAALWCMLFAHSTDPGPGFRFTVHKPTEESHGAWGGGSW
ncbi:DUF3846 domain-containing protein [Microbacterium profundi]|uniref:DUF3846 domain-containing protein n=1 Tax=Microbacterium profundi TaxID=450380 RepID=UPI00051A7791|nr:hypothetical protein [Microbacterium profundi]